MSRIHMTYMQGLCTDVCTFTCMCVTAITSASCFINVNKMCCVICTQSVYFTPYVSFHVYYACACLHVHIAHAYIYRYMRVYSCVCVLLCYTYHNSNPKDFILLHIYSLIERILPMCMYSPTYRHMHTIIYTCGYMYVCTHIHIQQCINQAPLLSIQE